MLLYTFFMHIHFAKKLSIYVLSEHHFWIGRFQLLRTSSWDFTQLVVKHKSYNHATFSNNCLFLFSKFFLSIYLSLGWPPVYNMSHEYPRNITYSGIYLSTYLSIYLPLSIYCLGWPPGILHVPRGPWERYLLRYLSIYLLYIYLLIHLLSIYIIYLSISRLTPWCTTCPTRTPETSPTPASEVSENKLENSGQ